MNFVTSSTRRAQIFANFFVVVFNRSRPQIALVSMFEEIPQLIDIICFVFLLLINEAPGKTLSRVDEPISVVV